MGKVIVLGATGTLGLPICRYLKEKGYDVLAVGHSNRGENLFNKLGVDFSRIEISDFSSFKALPQKDVDCVLNFAGCLPAMMKKTDSNAMYPDTIIKGTINVLDYMNNVGCKKLIFPQSVYDVHYLFGSANPISADAERRTVYTGDHSIYVTCKNAAIDVIKYYKETYGINTTILRLPGVYQYHPKPYILIDGKKRIKLERVWIEKAKKGEPLEVWGDKNRILESVCIEDFLQIVQKAIDKKDDCDIYNVGNGGVTIDEKVKAIRDVFCDKDHISKIIYRPDMPDSTQYVLDIEKTKTGLGYKPQYDWRGYLENLKWHMQNQPNKDIWGRFEDYYDLLNISNDEERFEK